MYVGLKQPRGDGERYVTSARAAAKETNCNRARLNFQAFALCDMKIVTREGCCVGLKMSYHLVFAN